jgi:hypothetical protein
MAECRHRQLASDRRLISDQTAKGLRTLAAPHRSASTAIVVCAVLLLAVH